MMPNARNKIRSIESSKASSILSMIDPMSINMELMAFFLSMAPEFNQMRLCDLISAYVSIAKESEHAGISMWANSFATP